MTNCQTEHFKKKQSSRDGYFRVFQSLEKLKVRKSIFEDGKKTLFRTFESSKEKKMPSFMQKRVRKLDLRILRFKWDGFFA
jgi:hypothetical protein